MLLVGWLCRRELNRIGRLAEVKNLALRSPTRRMEFRHAGSDESALKNAKTGGTLGV
jgi:hypothetical protein